MGKFRAKSAGAVREWLGRAEAAGHTLCAGACVVAEAQRNLEAKGADALPVLAAMLMRMDVAPFERTVLPIDVAGLLLAKDQPVLAAAIRLRCDALVTGDRAHFAALYGRAVDGVAVHLPRSLADALDLLRSG